MHIVRVGLLTRINMAGYIPQSFLDLKASDNNNKFARVWNTLLTRLDSQRIVLKPGFTEEVVGNHRAIGLSPIPNGGGGPSSWNGIVIFANLRNVGGPVGPIGSVQDYIDITRDTGAVIYTDSSNYENWPDGHEIYKISELSPGALIIH